MLATGTFRFTLNSTVAALAAVQLRRLNNRTNSNYEVSDASKKTDDISEDRYSSERMAHFGYQVVTEADKAERVTQLFKNVARSYDTMNDIMSLGIHRCWKDILVQRLHPRPGIYMLDMAGGTGDIGFRVMEQLSKAPVNSECSEIVVGDINRNMLEVGRQKAKDLGYTEGIRFEIMDAERLPFPDGTFDAYTIAFGLRNMVHIDAALREAWRVLRVGGRFMCLEFSYVENPIIRRIYDKYSFQVIPVMGMVMARDWDSYQYLVESIRKFPKQEELKTMIDQAGFSAVGFENLTFGIAAIHSGFKL